MADVMIGTPNGQMPAYLAVPADPGPWPGVVVVHDFAGMSHYLRNQADWLAGEGFLAAAPDLYYWGSRLRCLWTIMREVTAGTGRTVADIDAARDWLSARDDCTGRIGIVLMKAFSQNGRRCFTPKMDGRPLGGIVGQGWGCPPVPADKWFLAARGLWASHAGPYALPLGQLREIAICRVPAPAGLWGRA
jgi:carboxymethylenebutenolidase